MKLQSNALVFEQTKCHCTNGLIIERQPCRYDNRAQRGTPCQLCGSKVKRHNWINTGSHTCERCNGTSLRPETLQDYLPGAEWTQLPVKVLSKGAPTTANDALFGFGAIYTCLDYGRHWQLSDVELIEAAIDGHGGVSGYHVARPSGEVCHHIEIERKSQGYAVRARWADGGTNP